MSSLKKVSSKSKTILAVVVCLVVISGCSAGSTSSAKKTHHKVFKLDPALKSFCKSIDRFNSDEAQTYVGNHFMDNEPEVRSALKQDLHNLERADNSPKVYQALGKKDLASTLDDLVSNFRLFTEDTNTGVINNYYVDPNMVDSGPLDPSSPEYDSASDWQSTSDDDAHYLARHACGIK
jgi:hypothetical protein